MQNSPYNQLPEYIKLKYQIMYSELVFEGVTVFKNASGYWGVLTKVKKVWLFSAYECLIKPIFDSVGFNPHLQLIEAVKYENKTWDKDKNIFFYYDINGNKKWQSEKGEKTITDKFKNVFLSKNNNTGLLDADFKPLIPPKYEQISAINHNFFKVYRNGKYGIISRTDKQILDFIYTYIFNTSEKNKVLVEENNTYFTFDFDTLLLTKLPFDKILNAASNTYKAPSAESLNLYKSITKIKDNTNDDYAYEMVRYNGKWGVIDAAGGVLIPNDYSFVDFLRNPNYFKVAIGEIEVVDEDEQAYRTAIKNVKWGIIDTNNKVVVPIEYDWIDEVEATVWVVYKGGTVFYNDDYQEDYWAIEKAKLGVYNLTKLIVPIEYDTIKTTWFRINTFIFVQNGTTYFDEDTADYDVFALNGEQIKNNKPKPLDYNNNW